MKKVIAILIMLTCVSAFAGKKAKCRKFFNSGNVVLNSAFSKASSAIESQNLMNESTPTDMELACTYATDALFLFKSAVATFQSAHDTFYKATIYCKRGDLRSARINKNKSAKNKGVAESYVVEISAFQDKNCR